MSDELKKKVWEKARRVEGLDESMFRLDACGALIMWDKYGKENPFGWEIDHIYPISRGGNDDLYNLRALHYENNKSKADDYPSYMASVKYDGTSNIHVQRGLTINEIVRQRISELYNLE